MKFTIEITDPKHLDGLAHARAAYNVSAPKDKQLASDGEYVQFVANSAISSYAERFDADTVEGLKNRLAIAEAALRAAEAG